MKTKAKKVQSTKNLMAEIRNKVEHSKAAREGASEKAPKELSAKIKASMKALGAKIVHVAVEAHTTTLHMLMDCKGKDPLELEAIKEGVSDGWKEYAASLTARNTHSSRDQVDSVRRQSIYNRNSEMQAILTAFQKYAGLSPADRKEFDKALPKAGYHAVVTFCRNWFKSGKSKGSNATPVAARERKAWMKKKSERLAKAKEAIRWAPLDALMNLQDFISKRIDQLTKAAEQAQKEGTGKVHKMKRAA